MGEEALTALCLFPGHPTLWGVMTLDASEKCLQLQIHFATLSEPSKMVSRRSVWTSPEGVWWFLGQLVKTDSSLYCLGPVLSLLLALFGNSATMRDYFCCSTLLQPKVQCFSTRIPRRVSPGHLRRAYKPTKPGGKVLDHTWYDMCL